MWATIRASLANETIGETGTPNNKNSGPMASCADEKEARTTIDDTGANSSRRLGATSTFHHVGPNCADEWITNETDFSFTNNDKSLRANFNGNIQSDKSSASLNIDNLPPCMIVKMVKASFGEQTAALPSHADISAHLGLKNRVKPADAVVQASALTLRLATQGEISDTVVQASGVLIKKHESEKKTADLETRKDVSAGLTNQGIRSDAVAQALDAPTKKQNMDQTPVALGTHKDVSSDALSSAEEGEKWSVSSRQQTTGQTAAEAALETRKGVSADNLTIEEFIATALAQHMQKQTSDETAHALDFTAQNGLKRSACAAAAFTQAFPPTQRQKREHIASSHELNDKGVLATKTSRVNMNSHLTATVPSLVSTVSLVDPPNGDEIGGRMNYSKSSVRSALAKEDKSIALSAQASDTSPKKIVLTEKIMRNVGWVKEIITNAEGKEKICWLSPVTRMEFYDFKDAKLFETLRMKHREDEGLAWVEYSKHKPKVLSSVRLLGTHWRERGKNKRRCWISPIRKIEFKDLEDAIEFEGLRKMFGEDEVQAWVEFTKRKNVCELKRKVVSASQHDHVLGSQDEFTRLINENQPSIGEALCRYHGFPIHSILSRYGYVKEADQFQSLHRS